MLCLCFNNLLNNIIMIMDEYRDYTNLRLLYNFRLEWSIHYSLSSSLSPSFSLSLLKASHAHHTVLLDADKFSCILICVCVLRINLYSLSISRYKQPLSSLSFHMNLLRESSLLLKFAQNFRSKLWHHMYLNKQRTLALRYTFATCVNQNRVWYTHRLV